MIRVDMHRMYTRDALNITERVTLDLATTIHRRMQTGTSVVSWHAQVIAASFVDQLGIDAAIDEILRDDAGTKVQS